MHFSQVLKEKLKKKAENIYEIPKEGKMIVPVHIFASDVLMKSIQKDKTLEQAKNAAQLPGVIEKVVVMPDAHQGYGLPIGGVLAVDSKKGIISPGAIGYDINCGIRLIASSLSEKEFLKKRKDLLNDIYKAIPSGVGEGTKKKWSDAEMNDILNNGSQALIQMNFATKEDIEKTEDRGNITGADAAKLSQKARARGKNQLGTLGAGNHFVEIQTVETIFNEQTAKTYNLSKNQIVIMIHTGSRGLGHQTASDYIQKMEKEYGFAHLPDRELAYASLDSKLGKDYQAAMAAAANFAFANRQMITHALRETFKNYFSKSSLELIYDIAHNIAKTETLNINGKQQTLCIHRKGATRSFGPGRTEIPKEYQKVGCPIFIPGSMGTFSYVLSGTRESESLSFASTAHGAGRILSRSFAIKNLSTEKIKKQLETDNIVLKSDSDKGIAEEAPEAYKDVNEVVRVSDALNLGKLVARLKPLAVIKG